MALEEARAQLLAQHRALRDQLQKLSGLIEQVSKGRLSLVSDMRARAREFAINLMDHLEHEERVLEPLLHRGKAGGPERLERLKHEHLHQRHLLASMHARLGFVQSAHRLAEVVKSLRTSILLDMEAEERELLSPEVFSDERGEARQVVA